MNQKIEIQGVSAIYKRQGLRYGKKIYKDHIPLKEIEREKSFFTLLQPYAITVPIVSFEQREIVMMHGDDTLYGFLKKHEGLPREMFFEMVESVLKQMQHHCMLMSALGVVHGDLTLNNILVFYACEHDRFPKIKINDLGMSNFFNSTEEDRKEKVMIRSFLNRFSNQSDTYVYSVYAATFHRKFFRKPFAKDYEYDWYFFLHHLFIAFPLLHPAHRAFCYFTSRTLPMLHYYLQEYGDDCWYY